MTSKDWFARAAFTLSWGTPETRVWRYKKCLSLAAKAAHREDNLDAFRLAGYLLLREES